MLAGVLSPLSLSHLLVPTRLLSHLLLPIRLWLLLSPPNVDQQQTLNPELLKENPEPRALKGVFNTKLTKLQEPLKLEP